jgi:hypothetical protein
MRHRPRTRSVVDSAGNVLVEGSCIVARHKGARRREQHERVPVGRFRRVDRPGGAHELEVPAVLGVTVLDPKHVDAPVHNRPATGHTEKLAKSIGVHNPSDSEKALARSGRGIITGAQRSAVIVELDELTRVVERSTKEIEQT